MAKHSLVMGYLLRKNKNSKSTAYNRWFAFVDRMGVPSTRGLAQHMIEHGLVSNRAEVEGILVKLSECIPELVAQGYSVKLVGGGFMVYFQIILLCKHCSFLFFSYLCSSIKK